MTSIVNWDAGAVSTFAKTEKVAIGIGTVKIDMLGREAVMTQKTETEQLMIEFDKNNLEALIEQLIDKNILTQAEINGKMYMKVNHPSADEEIGSNTNYQEILDAYNAICTKMPRAEKVQADRRQHIKSRIKEYGREAVTEVFIYASRSPHHNGSNDTGWRADFDWLMKPANFRKMLERSRSGTIPAGAGLGDRMNQKPPRIAGAVNGSKMFLERVKNDARNNSECLYDSRPQLSTPVQRR